MYTAEKCAQGNGKINNNRARSLGRTIVDGRHMIRCEKLKTLD